MKKYQIIYADPPWPIKFGVDNNRHLRKSTGSPKGTWTAPNRDYPVMLIEAIEALPIKNIAEDDSVLFIWVVNRFVPEAYRVARAWGFKPSCLLTWAKTPRGLGLGGTFVQTTEHLLFARRGMPKANHRSQSCWWNWKRPEAVTGPKHSRKPEEARFMIQDLFAGKKIELFARQKTEGWDVWGNEVESDIQL